MNKLTLQINSLEALERLIGGDSEVEVDIRNSVVQKFAEKHLKSLANTPEISNRLIQIEEWIKKEVQSKIAQSIAIYTKDNYYNNILKDVKLHPNIEEKIDQSVHNLIDEQVRSVVNEAVKLWGNGTQIKKIIDQRFEYYTKEHINSEIKKRITLLVQ